MAKRVKVIVPMEMVVRDCDPRLLDVVDSCSTSRRRGATLPSRQLVERTGMSNATLHRSMGVCVEKGYLEIVPHRKENGAQLANSYVVTDTGHRVLTAARDQGLV